MPRKKTTEEFINEAVEVHGDEYIYSESIYDGKDKPLTIICRKHGRFKQTPSNHIRLKQGCPKCKYEKLSLKLRSNKDEFTKKARKVHGDKYEYIGEYINESVNMEMMCPIHGLFQQTPHSHLQGHGCPKCSNNFKLTNEEYIAKATEKHRGKYKYTNTVYRNSHSKIKIICPKHGEFSQVAYYHLQGAGCPKCNESKLEMEIRDLLEASNIDYVYQCSKTTFPWLKSQSLDFYLPKNRIAIECQGEQHYRNKDIFDSLEKNIERDRLKQNKCNNNGVKLLYYSHEKFKKYHTLGDFYCEKNELLKEIKKHDT